jgi:hypothetical protein
MHADHRRRVRRIGAAIALRLRALDRRLHIDNRGRSEWIWAVPIAGCLATLVLFVLQGALISGTTPALYVPIGLLVAGVIGGMSVAYMTPEADQGGPDDGGSDPPPPAPEPPPGGWSGWLRTPDDQLSEEPGPRRREPAGSAGSR